MHSTPKPFVSYSINHEDVLLNRLFGARSTGFFVDVGAAHPVFENDTKALSDRGWTGINVEPNAAFFRELVAQRPRDRNLNVVISDETGSTVFHEVVDTGLSTCDQEAAREAAAQGFQVIDHQIEALSLRQVFEDARVPQIDLLKIDVEGFELKVLQSNDWSRFRPLLVMTEATFPQTPVRRPDHITPYLATHGYSHVYFDGLNDYYAAAGFQIPAGVFDVPLNVFDGFVGYGQVMLEDGRQSLASEVAALREQTQSSDRYIASLKAAVEDASGYTKSLEGSLRDSRLHAGAMAERARAIEIDLKRADQEITNLRGEIARLLGAGAQIGEHAMISEVNALSGEISALRASTSWKITRPLRAMMRPRRTLQFVLRRIGL